MLDPTRNDVVFWRTKHGRIRAVLSRKASERQLRKAPTKRRSKVK